MAATMSALSSSNAQLAGARVASKPVARAMPSLRRAVKVQASAQESSLKTKLASAAAAAMLAIAPANMAMANEFDIIGEPTPTDRYYIDDAGVLNKTTKSSINKKLKLLEIETGYRVEVVTTRRLDVESDAFAFGDKIVENWYPTVEQGDNKGVLLIVTSGKDGALTGGPAFLKAIGDDLIDSVVNDNISIFTEEEKYNECVTSSVARVEAALKGEAVPEAPRRNDQERKRTYKTKDEVDSKKNVSVTVVGTLLFISVVVPMLQYYGYVAKD